MKNLTLTLATIVLFSSLILAQTARLQVIHNAADPAAASVDVWVNGSLLIDNFAFRDAEAFQTVPSGVALSIGIAPDTSTTAASSIAVFQYDSLANGQTYVLFANGTVAGGFNPNPDGINIGFNLFALAPAKEAATNSGDVDILVFHGATDAPTVDVQASTGGSAPATLIDNLAYTSAQGYASIPPAAYKLDVTDSTGNTVVASYLADVSGIAGSAAVVFASGFLDDSQGPAFGLWVALADGTTFPLPQIGNARAQIIHNAADTAAAWVDVYIQDVTGAILARVDSVPFRYATAFVDLPSNIDLSVAFAVSPSTDINDAVATIDIGALTSDETYIAIANGIVSPTGYSPSPAFGLDIFAGAREEAVNQGANETDVLVYHGSTDAPTVDVFETGVGAGTIVDDISYSEFQGYLSLSTTDYTIEIRDASGATTVVSYDAPLGTLGLENTALTVLASGFLDPTQNSDGAAFGLFVATAAGGALLPLPVTPEAPTGINEINSSIESIQIYPNPTSDYLKISFNSLAEQNMQLNIYNTIGVAVYNNNINNLNKGNNTFELNVSNLNQGQYMVQLLLDDGSRTTYPIFIN